MPRRRAAPRAAECAALTASPPLPAQLERVAAGAGLLGAALTVEAEGEAGPRACRVVDRHTRADGALRYRLAWASPGAGPPGCWATLACPVGGAGHPMAADLQYDELLLPAQPAQRSIHSF